MAKIKMGVIVGNRGFFADELCLEGRKRLLKVLESKGIEAVILPKAEGTYGSVESRDDARQCVELFNENRDDLKGIIISLPNFGDEKSIMTVIEGLHYDIPILVHAFPDQLDNLNYENRRDSFCGKISVCNNLRQYGYKFSVTDLHTVDPESVEFKRDLEKFTAVCRVVDRLKGARIGLLGARPADFNTVRFSEKILQRNKISVEPAGLIDLVNTIDKLSNQEESVKESLEEIKAYMNIDSLPEDALVKLAKLLVAYRDWVSQNELDAVAFRCWDSLQKTLGINPCLVMSIFSNQNIPSACESDVTGALSMLVLQEASGMPSGLVDWNNNYNNNPDKAVLFHCGNFPRDIYHCSGGDCPSVNYPPILASTLGKENTYGTIDGRIKEGVITAARISTDDNTGKIRAYLAEGIITDDQLNTFGSWGVVEINNLQELMRYICLNGFEHHVAVNPAQVKDILGEALGKYLGWDVYKHNTDCME